MPLEFPGETAEMTTGLSIRAIDHNGKQVVVMASQEVVQDHGLLEVQQVASDKYDSGQCESNGIIVLRNSDFS